ncbi:putative serine threonine-protein kinase nek9 [Rosellinia necatrix]|uniref:Putative serine threonine-protein kinase nek9 n=1 Tax=Rosellinia necatrix TaxID=77044 RepID=A0A1S8A5P0_ROSNE|nr:putative serine threonine-protein kinase nek9 [Rosellinia necatrix]
MNLYVTGFNAWRQLEFLSLETSIEEPDDIASFRKVLSDKLIEIHYISLTCTIVVTSAGLQYAGSVDDSARLVLEQRRLSFMTAVAGNGVIAVYDGHDRITQHASLPQPGETEAGQIFNGMHKIIQLVACETSFVALSADGKVWTWGDERYSATLGRDITISSPAERPSLVEDLEDLPSGKIKKIAAGGYTVFALTDGHDLYAWGGHPARRPIPETLSGSPSPLDVEENDIVDCAVGEAHMIVLTTKGDVYVAGDNTNGQLGLSLEKTANWRKVPMPPRGEDIIGVKAGQRSSFIVTKSSHLSNFHLGLL